MTSFAKYPFLQAVGLSELNEGAYYNGKWQTTNSTTNLETVSPSNE